MSELIQTRDAGIRRTLLATTSAFALAGYIGAAKAESDGRPTVWIELGGQLEHISNTEQPFSAPFLTQMPVPEPFLPVSPLQAQKPPGHAFGGEGKISFEPKDTDWIFSASVRFGRTSGNKHVQKTSPREAYQSRGARSYSGYVIPAAFKTPTLHKFAETKGRYDESHAILDFQVGKDVGFGMFGRAGSSTVDFGVRFAQFTAKSQVSIHANPNLNVVPIHTSFGLGEKYYLNTRFSTYAIAAHSSRSFHGIGPSLSWNTSAPLAGREDNAEFAFDWGINAAVLFGRQRASASHATTAYDRYKTYQLFIATHTLRYQHGTNSNRSRSVIVPNVGGFASLSLKFPNAKLSLGYRADFFLGAMDTGVDTRHTQTMGFHGPFATISVGLGG